MLGVVGGCVLLLLLCVGCAYSLISTRGVVALLPRTALSSSSYFWSTGIRLFLFNKEK